MPNELYGLLQRAADRTPDSPAILFKGRQVSYGELLEASTRAAAVLASRGAGPGRRVAFCFRKSVEALVALFGLIRTGAAYVPLDPTWPRPRQETICREAGIELWVGNVAAPPDTVRLALDPGALLGSAAGLSAGEPAEPAGGIANILYTSGSTGQPKGIEITARSLLHFSHWAVEFLGLEQSDRLANHAPYNFDLSTLDIFAAVRCRAAMCPVPEEIKGLPYQLARLIAEQRITVWYSVPFALTMMLDRLAAHDLSRLRHVLFAGEVMPKATLHALARAFPHATFTNLYGPTETNVCTAYRVVAEDLADDQPLPIGSAISDTRLWIINEEGTPLSDGAGELLVAGPTLTTGYLGDPELTARRLVAAPDGEGVAYRTGDRVSRRPDGALLFHGRCDRMIKCRGYRIEPGEVETVLCRHPGVKEAVVFLVQHPEAGDQLTASVAGDPASRPSEAELIALCRQWLPAGMLPDVWRFHDALPRTDRGKVDLQALRRT